MNWIPEPFVFSQRTTDLSKNRDTRFCLIRSANVKLKQLKVKFRSQVDSDINRLPCFSHSRNGFVLLHVLLFFQFFVWTVSYFSILKGIELIQREYYHGAVKRTVTEKEIIKLIKTNDPVLTEGSFVIDGQIISVDFNGLYIVSICDDFCYRMIVEYDRASEVILRLEYE